MYKLLKRTLSDEILNVVRIEDGAIIPFDENNFDYQVYLKWLDGYELQTPNGWVKTSDGNTPLPADE